MVYTGALQRDYERLNMMTLQEFLEKQFDEELMLAVLSGQRSKEKDAPSRVRIRPIELKGSVCYQASSTVGTKVLHSNYTKEEIISYVAANLGEGCFSQLQTQGRCVDGTVLVSKKGKMTVRKKQRSVSEDNVKVSLSHNRKKRYILEEGRPVPFLVDLGVQTKEGKVITSRYDKFRQINRFLEFIEDIWSLLPKDRPVHIIDFGCGKSYLTFAMYYYLHELKGLTLEVTGLDLKKDVIVHCNELAKKYHYEGLSFLHGDIADYTGTDSADMVVTLHACDTATDYALEKALEWDAKVILSVPCCQHELNRQIRNEMLQPVMRYGILKERMAALITDGLRAELLESKGYETQLLEFIDMEHTPKNILIRAVKTGKKKSRDSFAESMKALHVNPTLDRLLYPEESISQKGE